MKPRFNPRSVYPFGPSTFSRILAIGVTVRNYKAMVEILLDEHGAVSKKF